MDEASAISLGKRCGFAHKLSTNLEEIAGEAHVFVHEMSGARLLYLKNDDPNKSFSITFKTPAQDDTGVFHILEHSVLCGSKKFPVKEPFVTLLKSSMQTFLNAMTFPDKTMYPVASTNEQDLMNLMDVYLDAVFNPRIYSDKKIFEQEGWHFEIDGMQEDKLVYNGVVFNEMKGALSDPDQRLYDELSKALFPDTTYRYESGGIPSVIPDLTYEKFLETHEAHYAPSNSYIILYGDLNAERFMRFISDEYLTPLAKRSADMSSPRIDLQTPTVATGIKCEMETASDNSCTAFGYVVATSSDREKIAAASILIDAIMGSNESPLKRALLVSGIADDFEGYMSDSIAQPFAMISARGLKDNAVEVMRSVIEEEISRLAGAKGHSPELDESLIEASISHSEFAMREYDFGYPDGVMLSISAMSGWLYDDEPTSAISYIVYEDLFASLRAKLKTGYYADLLKEIFLDNDHYAQVEIVPIDCQEDPLALKLASLQEKMTPHDLEEIAAEADALHEAQGEPDDPKNIEKLPYLRTEDIGAPPIEPTFRELSEYPFKTIYHEVATRGIDYFSIFFDISKISYEEMPYVSILSMLYGKLDTDEHTASEIDTLVQSKFGSLAFSCDIYERSEDAQALAFSSGEDFAVKFAAMASCLDDRIEEASELACEILTKTDFSDTERIVNILVQKRIALEQRFSNAGNAVASARASSYFKKCQLLSEQIAGIDFYIFLKQLIADVSDAKIDIAHKMNEIARKVITRSHACVSFGGSKDSLHVLEDALALFDDDLDTTTSLEVPEPSNKHEAFVVPTDVSYSALVCDRSFISGEGRKFSGEWLVLSRILTYDYLWNEVRVKGGAYGVGFNMGRTGLAAFTSYRDPHVFDTFERFELSDGWLDRFNPSDREFEGYVVSCAASFDRPFKPRSLIKRQITRYFTGYSYEEYLEYRQQVIDSSLLGIKALAPAVAELCQNGASCVVGARELLDEVSDRFDIIDLLNM